MHDNPTTNAQLLLRLGAGGDEAAWAEFVQIYQPFVYRLARRRGFQDADATELAQDVLLVVLRNVHRWKSDRQHGSFRGWLFTVSRRLMINVLSSPARRLRGSGRTSVLQCMLEEPAREDAESRDFDLEFQRQLFAWAARRVQERVEPATWTAFWQTAVEARPPQAVASELGVRLGVVYVAKSRVMHQLRALVQRQLRRDEREEVGRD